MAERDGRHQIPHCCPNYMNEPSGDADSDCAEPRLCVNEGPGASLGSCLLCHMRVAAGKIFFGSYLEEAVG